MGHNGADAPLRFIGQTVIFQRVLRGEEARDGQRQDCPIGGVDQHGRQNLGEAHLQEGTLIFPPGFPPLCKGRGDIEKKFSLHIKLFCLNRSARIFLMVFGGGQKNIGFPINGRNLELLMEKAAFPIGKADVDRAFLQRVKNFP